MTEERTERAIFELAGSAPAQPGSEVLGLWSAEKASPPGQTSFAAGGGTEPEIPVWRVNLPSDSEQAAQDLALAENSLSRAEKALDVAEGRISALVEKRTSPAVFGVPSQPEGLAPPEQELLAMLNQAQYGKLAPSFGLADQFQEGWEQAVNQFQGFVDLVVQTLTHYAWVETRIAGRLAVRTAVSWNGDFETAWQEVIESKQMHLHTRTLKIALASRAITVRSFAVVAAAAGKLTALMSAPGGAILALPAAWKYINEIRAELEKYQQLTQEDRDGQ